MLLAVTVDLSPQAWVIIGLAVSVVGAGSKAYLEKRRADRAAKIAKSAFVGLKKVAADLSQHKSVFEAIEDGIYEAARDLGVEEHHIDAHVGDGLTPPAPKA